MVDLERVFGPLALELNPAVLDPAAGLLGIPADPHGAQADPGIVRVAFESAALAASARERLVGLGGRFCPGPGPARETLEVGAAALTDAAAGCPEARVLLEARKCLERRPNPPEIMGVINVTPDSFSDGGRYVDPEVAVEHGLELEAQGARILDVGGESTRPGAAPVDAAEETRRVLPVVAGLARRTRARISIDTTKASVAREALDAGASIVNDVRGGEADPDMLPLVAERGCDYVLMHAQGTPRDMQDDPSYADAPSEVLGYLRRRVAHCLRSGIDPTKITLDPGIGFGKRLEHNTALLRRLPELRSLGRPLLVGVSRKSFIGHITGESGTAAAGRRADRGDRGERVGGTAAAVTVSVLGGAEILRVHDVAVMSEAIRVAEALRPPSSPLPVTSPGA